MHKHHRRSEVFENADANKTRAARSPSGRCTCRQRLCLSAGASMCPPRRLEKKKKKKRKETERSSCNQLSNPKFWGWVKKLEEFFNICVSSTL